MVSVNNYRLLQAYGGLMDVAGTQVIADGNEVQFTSMDAVFGPTAYNTTPAADFDDITVNVGGIYQICFEGDFHNGEEGDTLLTIRKNGTAITNAKASLHFGSTAAEFSMFKHASINLLATLSAGDILDVTLTCSSACTVTDKNVRFWVRRICAAA